MVKYVRVIAKGCMLFSGATAGCTALAMTLLITVDVLGRYLVNRPTQVSVEMSGYLLVALVFLGLAYTEGHDRHIMLTFLTDRFSHRVQRLLMVANTALSILFAVWLTWLTLQPVLQDYALGSISLTGTRTPLWIPESLIPLGLGLFTVQLVARLITQLCPQAPAQGHHGPLPFTDT